jgi:hypothetical protein
MEAQMTFTHIALDPGGTYVGRTKDGLLWYYIARWGKWLLIEIGEDNAVDHRN